MISFVRRSMAFLLLLPTMPMVFLFGIAINYRYPGRMFYWQIREGKNGKPFKIYKLRTMVANANEILADMLVSDADFARQWQATGVIAKDPRIAGKWGRLARQLSVDELPQLWNVFRGEMAFVGPRPLEPSSLDVFPDTTRMFRSSVLPGITGLAQVAHRNATIRQMLFYDRIYISRGGFCMDGYIVFRTVKAVLFRTGA